MLMVSPVSPSRMPPYQMKASGQERRLKAVRRRDERPSARASTENAHAAARPMRTRLRKIQARCPAWWWNPESVCPSQKLPGTHGPEADAPGKAWEEVSQKLPALYSSQVVIMVAPVTTRVITVIVVTMVITVTMMTGAQPWSP
eukprot:scaffold57474_cov54-Phaeocystis_antarctica.AAC.2